MHAQLVSQTPGILMVQASAQVRTITSKWRAVIRSTIFDLKKDPRLSEDDSFQEMSAEA